jgi:hypothetical protein
VSPSFQDNVAAIDTNLTRLAEENRRMRRLLSEVALLVACQPDSPYCRKWLQEFEELNNG